MAGAVVVPTVTSGFVDFLQPKWHRVLVEVGSEIEELHSKILNVDPELAWNPLQEAQMSGLGQMQQKPEGTQFRLDSPIQGGSTTYTSRPWGQGFEWTLEMMRFDLYDLFSDISTDLVLASNHRVEVESFAMIEDGFLGALYKGFDGLSMFNTAHPFLDPAFGTFSNMSSTDISFSVAGLQVALLFYNTMLDIRGARPNKRRPVLALVHPLRVPAAREILGSEYMPYSGDNTLNSLTDDNLKYFAVRYFVNTAPWYLFARPAAANRGHDLWIRWAIAPTPDQFEDRRTRSSVQTMYQNFALGFGSPFGVWGSRGTGL
jgi:hypothetical protein